jgi:hypothetical protein
VRGQRRHAHCHNGSFGLGQRPNDRQELLGPRPIDQPEQGLTAAGQTERALPAILSVLAPIDQLSLN